MAIVYGVGGIVMLVAIFVVLGKYSVTPATTTALNLTAVPTFIPTSAVLLAARLDVPAPAAPATVVVVITATPAPTVPVATATTVPNVIVVLKRYWPAGRNLNVKTASGALPTTVEDRAVACPGVFPLGSELRLVDGRLYTCLDRLPQTCTGKTCPFVVYSRSAAVGVYYGWIDVADKIWSPAKLPSDIPK